MRIVVAVVVLAFLPSHPTPWRSGAVRRTPTHTGVGAMYFDEDGDGVVTADWLVCTGSYAGRSKDGQSDVILMAGHCLPPAEEEIPASALRFSFDRDARDGVTGTIAAKSYHQMPGFGHDAGDRRDLGIVLLPAGSASGRPPSSCRARATWTRSRPRARSSS